MIQSNFSDSAIRLIMGWIVGYFMIRLLTNGMFAAEGYAWISGWWLTNCLEMGLALRIWHAFYLLVMCFAVSVSWQVFDVISNSVDIGFPYTAIKLLVHAIVFESSLLWRCAGPA